MLQLLDRAALSFAEPAATSAGNALVAVGVAGASVTASLIDAYIPAAVAAEFPVPSIAMSGGPGRGAAMPKAALASGPGRIGHGGRGTSEDGASKDKCAEHGQSRFADHRTPPWCRSVADCRSETANGSKPFREKYRTGRQRFARIPGQGRHQAPVRAARFRTGRVAGSAGGGHRRCRPPSRSERGVPTVSRRGGGRFRLTPPEPPAPLDAAPASLPPARAHPR